MGLDEIFKLSTICSFEWAKTPNIKRLGKVRRVCREAKSDNVVGLAVFFELGRLVAFVAIKNNYPIYSFLVGLSMLVEVLYPF